MKRRATTGTRARGRALAAPVTTAALLGGCSGDPSALDPEGRGAREIAALWWVMVALAVPVMVLVVVLLLRAARPGAAGPAGADADADADVERSGRRWVLLGGVVLPLVVILPLSFLTLRTGERLNAGAPAGAVQIEVRGSQFWWEVRYPGTRAVTANEVHLPAGEPVQLTLTSSDVIHSFWVPDLHGKIDLVPGETTRLVLEADEAGVHEGLCAEFCGIQHTHMRLLVVVHERDDFDRWLAHEAADAAPPDSQAEREGAEVFARTGCASCHTVRGTDADGVVGPDLTHLASRRTLGANTIPNTRGDLGGWVANAQHIKPGNRMPPSVLSGHELTVLLDYLEALE